MRIVILHQYYLMPGFAGGSRFNEFARMWAAAGHEVSVIAGNLDYATGHVPEQYRGRWVTREHDEAVEVWRCHVPRTYRRNYVGRMWAFAGFTLSAATAALRVRRADVVIATSPPLIVVLPAWLASRRGGARSIFEIRDLWPESAITTGVLNARSPLTQALYGLEKWACASSDRINVLTPAFRADLERRRLAGSDKIVFIPNGADLDMFTPRPRHNEVRAQYGWGERTVFMYAGAHGRANALSQLIDAAERLRACDDIVIACVGDGPERPALVASAAARGLSNIVFLGPQPKERMPDFVNAADVGLAVLQNNPTFRTVYPNKVFDYMACERPVLLAIDGVARQLVCDSAQAGVFAPPEDGAALAAAMRRLADAPEERRALGERGRLWVENNASRDALAARYLEVMHELVGERPS